ncbi:MAG: SDR family NAD(P)-dependent oxidoreductase [Ruminococcaceae bacterium]|nr:SDR family NAD(P)-dependent oxidoreductase [Oscillospiraceae bacterium]
MKEFSDEVGYYIFTREGLDMFNSKNCIVTGAASGIGFGLTKKLLAQGATVWMADVNEENLKAKADEVSQQYPGKVQYRVLDVTNDAAFKELAAEVAATGPIGFLANNAGIACAGIFTQLEEAEMRRVIDINVMGVIHGCQAVLPYMVRDGGGHILNLGSIASFTPLAWRPIYNASKYAVLGLTTCLREELNWMECGVKLHTACPSTVDTNIFGGMTPGGAITPDDAAREILEGIERGDEIIPVTDHARFLWDSYNNDKEAFNTEVAALTKSYKPLLLQPEHCRNIMINKCK